MQNPKSMSGKKKKKKKKKKRERERERERIYNATLSQSIPHVYETYIHSDT
jgi:hypothetical protein